MEEKMMLEVKNNKIVKDKNMSIILRYIKNNPNISRIDISKNLVLSPPTVSRIVDELVSLKILEVTNIGESNGGRKPILYSIKNDAGYVIGIDITKKEVKGALFNLLGEKTEDYCKKVLHPNDLINFLIEFINEIIIEQKNRKILGIGIGVSGDVSHKSGIVRFSNFFGSKDVPLRDILNSHLDYLIMIEERVNCAVLADKFCSSFSKDEDIVYMQIGSGIGSGIIIRGEIYYGSGKWVAGEVGHIVMDPEGPQCVCGSRGCLEQLSSETAIIRDVLKELKKGEKSILNEMIGKDYDMLNGNIIVEATEKGDKVCTDVLNRACKYLALGINNICMMLNPAKIIITNNISSSDTLIKDLILKSLKEIMLNASNWCERIVFENDKDRAMKGSAAIIIEEVFERPKDFLKV